jgi:phosphoglycolate phosphatase
MNHINIRTVLFDLDGTLADTAPDLADALNVVLEERCRRTLSFDTIRPIVSHGTNALIYLGFELAPGDDGFTHIQQRLLEIYKNNIANKTRLFPGMAEVLDEIEGRGMSWGVVTNKPGYLTLPLMEALELHRRAACIVSGDTTPKRKPDPEPMFHAAALAGVEPGDCLYIGDAERDIEAGRRAGMITLAALFGYIGDHDNPHQWGAHGMVEHPKEILDWIDKVKDPITKT